MNWCPALGTVLSNEEVTADGRSERGNFPVFRRRLRQWMMRITAYADRLADDLDSVDWPDAVKAMQRNWIGRSPGARAIGVRRSDPGRWSARSRCSRRAPTPCSARRTWCWRPSTPLVDGMLPAAWPRRSPARSRRALDRRGQATPPRRSRRTAASSAAASDVERQEARGKTGVFTGTWAINPVDGEPMPVFMADYVLMGYGTGAIMAVPGQDQRDWDFATVFGLPIVRTVQPPGGLRRQGVRRLGPAINSANDEISLNGLGVTRRRRDHRVAGGRGDGEAACSTSCGTGCSAGSGTGASRSPSPTPPTARPTAAVIPGPAGLRAAGAAARRGRVLPEDVRPRRPRLRPGDAAGPRGRVDWLPRTRDSDLERGWAQYIRETNTMPQWAGSCWYHLRYLDPFNTETFCDPEVERTGWVRAERFGPGDPGGVDLYVGGVEHAVLHLLYARFWQKVLFDLGYVSASSPSAGCSTRATSRPGPTPTRAGCTCRPRRSWRVPRADSRGTASRSPASTGRWGSR